MKRSLLAAACAALLAFASLVAARGFQDIEDGKLIIQPKSGERFAVEGNIMGKAQLFGFVSDLKDREKFNGIVLGEGGDEAQRSAIRAIADTLKLQAFAEEGGKLVPIGD